MKPTYKELERRVAEQDKQLVEQSNQLVEQDKLIKQLLERITHLENQLNKNSKNSSKPPSTDQKSSVPRKARKEARPFHPGASRQLVEESLVTSQTDRHIDVCPRCHSAMIPTGEVTKWQQIEMPEIKPLVHQWNLHTCQCSQCQFIAKPKLHEDEQYLLGPRFEALVNLCLGRFRMGHLVVREFIGALLPNVNLSQGLISKIKRRGLRALSSSHEQIIEHILQTGGPIHSDATGWRHMGANEHAVVMRVNNWVAFCLVPRQNKEVFKKLLPKRGLYIVSDRGLPVSGVGARIHQYCLAHLLRNLQGLAEHPATTIDEAQEIGIIHEAIQHLFIDRHRMERGEISVDTWRQYGYRTWKLIEELIEEVLANDPSKKVGRALRRIQKGWKHFKAYLRRPDLPMTNNAAEEALRSLVIARKLCFGSRSSYGKAWRAKIQSCIETLRRQGRSILDFIADAIKATRIGSSAPDIRFGY
jgi:transposase